MKMRRSSFRTHDNCFVTILLLLFTRICLISAACTKDNTSVRTAVIAVAKSLNDSAKILFNITNGSDGFIQGISTLGHCERWNISILDLNSSTELPLYEPQVSQALDQANIIFGDENNGIQSFISQNSCYSCFAFHFRFTPVGIATEREIQDRFIRADKNMATSYSLFPSPTSFVNCVVGNVALLTKSAVTENRKTRVVILSYAESEDALRYVDKLQTTLDEQGMVANIVDLHYLVALLTTGSLVPTQVDALFSVIQRMIFIENKADMVLFYMDAPLNTQIQTLNVLLSKRAQLDRSMPWLIADSQTMLTPGAREELPKLDLVNIRLYVLRPCLVLDDKDALATMNECHSKTVSTPLGVDMEGLTAGRTLLENIMKHRTNDDPYSFLKSKIQTDCPGPPNITQDQLESDAYLECGGVNTARMVGFPRYDHIITELLNPNSGSSNETITANYFHKDRFHEWHQLMVQKNSDFTMGTATIHVQDYVVFGHKSPDRVDYAVLVPEIPFIMKSGEGGSYTGMCIDIYNAVVLRLIERGILLKLRFYEVGSHGTLEADGTWSGACGQLLTPADPDGSQTVLAIGSFETTNERLQEDRFTFSAAFAQIAPTYLVKTQTLGKSYTQFLRPFTSNVWMLLLLVFVLSALYLRAMQAWNPFRQKTPEESDFNWAESFWHSYLIVTQIGAPFGAVHGPSRVYSVFYWFFALVVVGCYTGNLAGFLTETSSFVPTIAELVRDRGFAYGMVKNGSRASNFLEGVVGKTNAQLLLKYAQLQLVSDYAAGAKKVKEEDFILLGNTIAMQHYQQTDPACELSLHHSHDYYSQIIQGLAMPMRTDWDLADDFKTAMRELKESGELQLIYHKWIDSNKQCSDNNSGGNARLTWQDFVGLFILVTVGIFLSFIILGVKLVHLKLAEKRKVEYDEKDNENGADVEQNGKTNVAVEQDENGITNVTQF